MWIIVISKLLKSRKRFRFFRYVNFGSPKNTDILIPVFYCLIWKPCGLIIFEGQAVQFLKQFNKKIKFANQDALNALFYRHWEALPIQWNVKTEMGFLGIARQYLHYDRQSVINAVRNLSIVHFTQSEKPDSFLCVNPFVEEYWDCLGSTPWAGKVTLQKRTFRGWIQKVWILLSNGLRGFPFFVQLRAVKQKFARYGC